MTAPDFREALAGVAHDALVARGPWRPEALAEDVADAVLALLAERLGGDEVREALCIVMHDAYEAEAVRNGWETQERSRKPWADVPEANKATMRAAVDAALAAIRDHLGVQR